MAKFANVEEAIKYNTNKVCKVKGCYEQRYRVSGYCITHNKRNSMTGSPVLGNIYPYQNLYSHERSTARKLIEHNRETHKGVQYTLKFFAGMLSNVCEGVRQNGLTAIATEALANQIRRIDIHPEEMLEIAAAFYAYAYREPSLMMNDNYFNTQLGTQLLKTSRHMAMPSGKDKRVLSTYIQKQLGIILVNLSDAIRKRLQQEDTVVKVQHAPLSINF